MLIGYRAAVLEKVIVTAQRREQSLQDVPISITAASQEKLDQFEVTNLFDLANFVPGVMFSKAPDDGLVLSLPVSDTAFTKCKSMSWYDSLAAFDDLNKFINQ